MDIRQSETMDQQIKQSHPQNQGLTRAMSFFDVICLGINSVVGAGIFLLPGQLCSLAGDLCTVGIPDVRSPLFHHFPVLCRDGGNVQQDRRRIPVCQGGIRAVCGVFGGLDDVAFVHHWLGLGR